jgi:hypothetical protein
LIRKEIPSLTATPAGRDDQAVLVEQMNFSERSVNENIRAHSAPERIVTIQVRFVVRTPPDGVARRQCNPSFSSESNPFKVRAHLQNYICKSINIR